jgi:hypothetical protein
LRRGGPRDRPADAHSTIWGLAADPASPLPRPPGTGARRHSVNRRKSQIAAGCRRREAMSAIGQLIHAGSLPFGSPARIRFCSSAVKFAPPGHCRAALSHNLLGMTPQGDRPLSAAARRRRERPACSPARGSGRADHRLAARCRPCGPFRGPRSARPRPCTPRCGTSG